MDSVRGKVFRAISKGLYQRQNTLADKPPLYQQPKGDQDKPRLSNVSFSKPFNVKNLREVIMFEKLFNSYYNEQVKKSNNFFLNQVS